MFIFLFAGLLAVFLAYQSQYKQWEFCLVWAFVIMWFIAAFQDCIGWDFKNYKDAFDGIMQGKIEPAFIRVDRDQIEIGYYLLCKGPGGLFGTFYTVTPIVYAIVLYPIYKLLKLAPSRWRWLAVFYFYFGVKWFLLDMSGQRQAVAIAFWILLVFALQEKRYIRAAIFVVLGIAFHNSFIYSLLKN